MMNRPSDKFDRYEDGSVVFPNGGGYDPEEKRNISPRERSGRLNPNQISRAIASAIAALHGGASDIVDRRVGDPGRTVPGPSALTMDTATPDLFPNSINPIADFLAAAVAKRAQQPIVLFPANTQLGQLQRAFGVGQNARRQTHRRVSDR